MHSKSISVRLGLVPTRRLQGDSAKDTKLLRQMWREAERFILSHGWCASVLEQYFGVGVGGVVAVFLFKIRPTQVGVDEWLWVVVGDVPPAYLVADDNPTAIEALRAYVREMRKWVSAVKHGKRVDELIPVNAPPNREHALQLESRLTFISKKLIPQFQRSHSKSTRSRPYLSPLR